MSQPRRQTILSRSHQPHLGCSNQDPKTELQPDDASLSTADLLETGEYCDVYLTHDSMSVRKAHNSGRNHLRNVEAYYASTWRTQLFNRKDHVLCSADAVNLEIGQEEAQSVIDSITASYAAEGQPMPNPAMLPPGAFPPPFGLPGTMLPSNRHAYTSSTNNWPSATQAKCHPLHSVSRLPELQAHQACHHVSPTSPRRPQPCKKPDN